MLNKIIEKGVQIVIAGAYASIAGALTYSLITSAKDSHAKSVLEQKALEAKLAEGETPSEN